MFPEGGVARQAAPDMSDTEGPQRFISFPAQKVQMACHGSRKEGMAGPALGGSQLAGAEGVGLASGRGNGLEKAQGTKYRHVVNGSAFGVVSRMRVSKGRLWALSHGTGETSSVICALERSPWRPVLRTSQKEAESETRRGLGREAMQPFKLQPVRVC